MARRNENGADRSPPGVFVQIVRDAEEYESQKEKVDRLLTGPILLLSQRIKDVMRTRRDAIRADNAHTPTEEYGAPSQRMAMAERLLADQKTSLGFNPSIGREPRRNPGAPANLPTPGGANPAKPGAGA